MVSATDVKYKKSSSGVSLGGAKSATVIATATPHNLFDTISAIQARDGRTEYRCFYVENGHSTEDMDDCDIFLQSDNPNSTFSTIQWGLEPYRYSPYDTFNGTSDFISEPNAAELQVNTWTCAGWIRTSHDHTTNGFIVNKGGSGSDTAGQNMTFGVWIASGDDLRAGFETSAGTDNNVNGDAINDGFWHYFVASYDGAILQLFVDDMINPLDTLSTTSLPEQNTHPVVLGRNSRASDSWYTGDMDEIRIWNRALSQDERLNLYNWGTVPANGLIYENKFGDDDFATVAQIVSDQDVAPKGVNWLGVTNGPISNTPTLGTLPPSGHVPIWVRWVVNAGSPDAFNDHCVFQVQGKIPAGGTGGGGSVPPPAVSPFTFVAVGDWGCKTMTENIVNQIEDINPRLVLGLGDNSYATSAQCFLDRIEPIDDNQGSDIDFFTVFGNHDNAESEEESTETALKNHFGITNTYSRITIENVCFIFIDNTTETTFTSGSAQHTAVSGWLAEARASSNVDWIVVCCHKPMWGAVSEHGYNSGNFNQAYGALFDTYKVDLILTGHNHNWQQTEQTTYNSGSPTNPTVVDEETPYVGGVGRIHCVVGTAGQDSGSGLYELESVPAFMEYQSDEHNGVLKCTLSNNNLTMTCQFVDLSGSVEHTFVINR